MTSVSRGRRSFTLLRRPAPERGPRAPPGIRLGSSFCRQAGARARNGALAARGPLHYRAPVAATLVATKAGNPSRRKRGAIAQLGERFNGIEEVVGSIPSGSTKDFSNRKIALGLAGAWSLDRVSSAKAFTLSVLCVFSFTSAAFATMPLLPDEPKHRSRQSCGAWAKQAAEKDDEVRMMWGLQENGESSSLLAERRLTAFCLGAAIPQIVGFWAGAGEAEEFCKTHKNTALCKKWESEKRK